MNQGSGHVTSTMRFCHRSFLHFLGVQKSTYHIWAAPPICSKLKRHQRERGRVNFNPSEVEIGEKANRNHISSLAESFLFCCIIFVIGLLPMIRLVRRRSGNSRRKNPSLLIWVVLIFAQFCLFSVMVEARSFPARTQLVEFAPFRAAPSSSQEISHAVEGNVGKFVGDEKRMVHTGPNPLHN